MTIITQSCRVPSNAERRDDWRRRIGTYRSKYPRVPNCPVNEELDERTPAPHTTKPAHVTGKDMT